MSGHFAKLKKPKRNETTNAKIDEYTKTCKVMDNPVNSPFIMSRFENINDFTPRFS